MTNWPSSATDWETLIWAALSSEVTQGMRNRAGAEMVRRAGSMEAANLAIRERLTRDAPIGTLLDWEPSVRAPTSTETPGQTQVWTARTETGSEYRIWERGDVTYALEARNVPNPNSRDLSGALRPISRPTPWPPLVGQPLSFVLLDLAKIRVTSRVVRVEGPEVWAEA